MPLTVGELARGCGLTVRTLHHYDAVGLLRPSLRSDAGYRLYDRAGVERLHRIQALRQLGLPLADIGTVLSGPEQPLGDLIDRQIAQLDHELDRAARLRGRLLALRGQLSSGQSPDLAEWLDTLELMTMYEKYFSPEELESLPLHNDPDIPAQWNALIGEVQAAMDGGLAPESPRAHALALQWMAMVQRGTGDDPGFINRLKTMQDNEPELRGRNGITPALERFVERALVDARLVIFQRYLLPSETECMRANYGRHMYEWPQLIAGVRSAMNAGRRRILRPDDSRYAGPACGPAPSPLRGESWGEGRRLAGNPWRDTEKKGRPAAALFFNQLQARLTSWRTDAPRHRAPRAVPCRWHPCAHARNH